MADKIDINLEENSPYRVALDLAYKIAHAEQKLNSGGNREYWLKLYQQARKVVVDGSTAAYALKLED